MKTHFLHAGHFVRQTCSHSIDLSIAPEFHSQVPACSEPTSDRTEVAADVDRVIVLSEDQCLTIVASDGRPLLEIVGGETGPSIRLVHDDLRIGCPGKLDFSAQAITMTANDDVTVRGKTIRLN